MNTLIRPQDAHEYLKSLRSWLPSGLDADAQAGNGAALIVKLRLRRFAGCRSEANWRALWVAVEAYLAAGK